MEALIGDAGPHAEEEFDIVDATTGLATGERARRSVVHATGLYHRAVHVWLFAPATGEVLLQRRALDKDSWPGALDISCAGHVSAGDAPLPSAVRELEEELGIVLPPARFEWLFTHVERLESVQRGARFVNNEFNDVFLVTLSPLERAALDPAAATLHDVVGVPSMAGAEAGAVAHAPIAGFALQRSEVSAVEWRPWRDVERLYLAAPAAAAAGGAGNAAAAGSIVPTSDMESYMRLFRTLEARATEGGLPSTGKSVQVVALTGSRG